MSVRVFWVVLIASLIVAFGSSFAVLVSGDQGFAWGICVGLVGLFAALEKRRPRDTGGTGPTGEAGTPYFTSDSDAGGGGGCGGGGG